MADVLKMLAQRGFVGQVTDLKIGELLKERMVTYYVGFDPTAASLHIGNLKQIMMMAHLQRAGHRPIALVGGGTGMIGDPSGKTKERQLLSKDDIAHNLAGIRSQLERFLDFESGNNSALIVNNADWLVQFSFIDFLREVGKYFRVGEMLGKESVRIRINSEEGMSFTEFCYQLLQAYDFLHLHDHHDCLLQMGGSDQWGNITAGIELVRKLRAKPAYGITSPLVVTASGEKFGKSEAGAIWLAADRTSPYEFYQYWVRADDRDVIAWLRTFTFLETNEIAELEKAVQERPEQREAQKRLADEVTALVHGREEATAAIRASGALFGEQIKELKDQDLAAIFNDVPSVEIEKPRLAEGMSVIDLLVETGLCKSRGEARRLVGQGGAYLNNLAVDSAERRVTLADLASETMLVLRTGKKKYLLLKTV